ncbi:MAG: inverse autotransporter beta domain-containing protein [Alphaproteobacteria bacterium]|nr:inverse autotransporter beta domain-containing protein [Alphaproteobacteria bacterium]
MIRINAMSDSLFLILYRGKLAEFKFQARFVCVLSKFSLIFAGIAYVSLMNVAYAQQNQSNNFAQSFFGGSLNTLQSQMSRCNTALNEGHTDGRDCIMQGVEEEIGNRALNYAFNTSEDLGKNIFGEHFQISNRLRYSAVEGVGVQGNLDTVVPLINTQMQANVTADRDSSSRNQALKRARQSAPTKYNLFLQQGVTRWQDAQGMQRNDMRWGLVYRFNLTPVAGENILGFATFIQQNAERGHSRVVSRYDYSGKWGTSWVNYYSPTTGWRDGREGHEERAIGGSEVGHKFNITNNLTADISASQWETTDADAPVAFEKQTSVGLQWRPHEWMSFSHRYGNSNTNVEPILNYEFTLNMPLGRDRSSAVPRWKGLGVAGENQAADPNIIWRPVDNLREIKYVEREKQVERVEDAIIEFMFDSVESGDSIPVKVTLPNPATEDTTIYVRLEPGDRGVPAVAGEDYIDETVEMRVVRGQTSAEVQLQILRNDDMTETRTIKVIVERLL